LGELWHHRAAAAGELRSLGGHSEFSKEGDFMAGAKLIVLYPSPRDVNTFERAYTQDHVPMVTTQNFKGIRKFIASKIVGPNSALLYFGFR
jgi:hypothetical protein